MQEYIAWKDNREKGQPYGEKLRFLYEFIASKMAIRELSEKLGYARNTLPVWFRKDECDLQPMRRIAAFLGYDLKFYMTDDPNILNGPQCPDIPGPASSLRFLRYFLFQKDENMADVARKINWSPTRFRKVISTDDMSFSLLLDICRAYGVSLGIWFCAKEKQVEVIPGKKKPVCRWHYDVPPSRDWFEIGKDNYGHTTVKRPAGGRNNPEIMEASRAMDKAKKEADEKEGIVKRRSRYQVKQK